MQYWENIADNHHDAGWSLGWVSALDLEGRTIWIVDAHGYGNRFVVHADQKLTAFVERESAICALRRIGLTDRRDFTRLGVVKRIRIRRRLFPAQVLRLFRTRNLLNEHRAGKTKRKEEA